METTAGGGIAAAKFTCRANAIGARSDALKRDNSVSMSRIKKADCY